MLYSTRKLGEALSEVLAVHEMTNVNFYVYTDREHYPIIFEALAREGRFCCLEASFSRRLRLNNIRGYPLGVNGRSSVGDPCRCLIIEANVKGTHGEKTMRHAERTIERILRDAAAIGPSTAKLVALILETRPYPEQGYRACLGILRLARQYGADRAVIKE